MFMGSERGALRPSSGDCLHREPPARVPEESPWLLSWTTSLPGSPAMTKHGREGGSPSSQHWLLCGGLYPGATMGWSCAAVWAFPTPSPAQTHTAVTRRPWPPGTHPLVFHKLVTYTSGTSNSIWASPSKTPKPPQSDDEMNDYLNRAWHCRQAQSKDCLEDCFSCHVQIAGDE